MESGIWKGDVERRLGLSWVKTLFFIWGHFNPNKNRRGKAIRRQRDT
jgi:hypothetical protein